MGIIVWQLWSSFAGLKMCCNFDKCCEVDGIDAKILSNFVIDHKRAHSALTFNSVIRIINYRRHIPMTKQIMALEMMMNCVTKLHSLQRFKSRPIEFMLMWTLPHICIGICRAELRLLPALACENRDHFVVYLNCQSLNEQREMGRRDCLRIG